MRLQKRVVLFLLLFILIIGGTGCMSSSNASTEEKAIQYLEEKYDKEFEVMFAKEGSKLFQDLYGGDKVVVHPKDDSEAIFLVEEANTEGDLMDSYIPAKWGQELQSKLADSIENELPEDSPYKLTFHVNSKEFEPSMASMTVDEYLSQNKNVRVVLTAGIKSSGEPDVKAYSQGIFNLYNLLKGLGVESYIVSVGFVDSSEDISEYIRTINVNNMGWSNLNAKVYGELGLDERNNPDNPSESFDPTLILNSENNVVENYTPFEG